MYLGVIIGVSSAIGFVGGGYLADRLGSINRKYALWAVAASALMAWLFVFPLYLIEESKWVLILFFIASVPTNVYLATHLRKLRVWFAFACVPPRRLYCYLWVYAEVCGLILAFLGSGGRNAATIFS